VELKHSVVMADRTKRILKFVLRLSVTAVLLWLILSRIDLQQVGRTIKAARWQFLIIVWLLAILAFWIRSVKMAFILKKQNCEVDSIKIFGASSVTMLYSLIMPGLLSTGVKWYILKQHTGKGSNVFSSMVYNQLIIFILVSTIALVALIATNPADTWQLPAICLVMLVLLTSIYLSLLNHTVGPKLTSRLSHILKPLPKSLRDASLKILEQLSVFQTSSWSFHLKILTLEFSSTTVVSTTIYIFAAEAARIDVPILVLVWQSAVVFMLGRLPISIANLGVREATLIGTLALYGVDASSAFLMSMIIFSNVILMAVIGAIFQLYWVFHKPEEIPRANISHKTM
jgi:uncharacterized membrane protein YbhN (UPF0104 family)